MAKKIIINLVNQHPKLFLVCSLIYNFLSVKNRLFAKGCKITIGISQINGLKLICDGKNNRVYIDNFVRIKNCTIIIHGDNNIIRIKDFAFLNKVEFYTEDASNEIVIGSHSCLCGQAHLAAIEGTKIIVGDNCLFSNDIHFRTGDSHSIVNMQGERINESKDINIDNHVWIGTRVTCLKGVHVSRDSVVAAATTLCKCYTTPNVIIGGVPGKIIKTNISWQAERK